MKRSLWMATLAVACAGALTAQQGTQDQYQGTSNPPNGGAIKTYQEPVAKPAPGKPMSQSQTESAQPAQSTQQQGTTTAVENNASTVQNTLGDGTDDGIVMLAPDNGAAPALNQRQPASDPDGDIVHPAPLPPGTLGYGTTIRARLRERISTAYSTEGEAFHATVASDVVQDEKVLIPAGAEIDGTVAQVSTGRFAGHGSMVLRPQTVTLSNGSKYHLYAQVSGTPGANAHVGEEGKIAPGSRVKKDSIEYGGGVGVGMIAGGAMGGPAGVLAGSLVGAGAITLHLMMDHPQATLEAGTVLLFSLTQPLRLEADTASSQGSGEQPARQSVAVP